MVRISGVDLPDNGIVEFALTKLYGIGPSNVRNLLKAANVDKIKRIRELTEQEVAKLQQIIDKDYIVEGDLRRSLGETIKRLKVINSYRGIRHSRGLPVRGQRTKSNARTRRGKRKTVGALKKEDAAKAASPSN